MNDDLKDTHIVYSQSTGQILFSEVVENPTLRRAITRAIRKGEDISFEAAKAKVLELLKEK